jgi:diacylglycerol kinase (ATP)
VTRRHRIALVVNPVSGVGRAARLAAAVAQRLGAGASVQVHAGATPEESADLLRAVAGASDAVVVLGGDGIVHLALQALALGDVPLGIVPAGTGNDTADALGLPADPMAACDAVLAALDSGSVRRIDLGHTSAGQWWGTVLCAGFDSAVTRTANKLRWPKGPRRYDIAIGVEVLKLRARPMRIRIDDEQLELPITLVAVGNAPQYGGGKYITPHAKMDDGVFSVAVIEAVSRIELARMAPSLNYAGHLTHPAVRMYSARTVELEAPRTVAYADGEYVDALPVRTECVPRALPVLVPPG